MHDNARSYVAQLINDTLTELGLEVLSHLPYSPPKNLLEVKRFDWNEKKIGTVQKLQPKEFYYAGMRKLACNQNDLPKKILSMEVLLL